MHPAKRKKDGDAHSTMRSSWQGTGSGFVKWGRGISKRGKGNSAASGSEGWRAGALLTSAKGESPSVATQSRGVRAARSVSAWLAPAESLGDDAPAFATAAPVAEAFAQSKGHSALLAKKSNSAGSGGSLAWACCCLAVTDPDMPPASRRRGATLTQRLRSKNRQLCAHSRFDKQRARICLECRCCDFVLCNLCRLC